MAHESFEDDEVAALLNREFVSIKVDREERPDVDHLYMTVCQAMTGQGGWPLTVVLTPDKKPFFAGTYFPKQRRYGRPGIVDILTQLADKWKEDHERVAGLSDQIIDEMKKRTLASLKGDVSQETLDKAYRMYKQLYDAEYGGFGDAPKFPTSHNLSFLLRYYRRTGEADALAMVEKTLEGMHRGGMYDHLGFAFARYSTDRKWLVPHFEKMLYDNALLVMTYVEAYQATNKRYYADVAERIIEYVLRDMTDPEGGFYSAEDADSEGGEGKFYVWTPDEVTDVLGADEGELICELYDISEHGNFEGRSIPNLIHADLATFAKRKSLDPAELGQRIEASRQKLFEAREGRIHPGKDDKILTAWNGLMIMALAKAAKALGEPRYAEAAARAVRFIRSKLVREDGRLLARYRDGEAAYPAYLDDYAFLVWGLIELYEATFRIEYLKQAQELNRDMLRLFWDEEEGGLFFTGSDGEELFTRPKEIYDGALPSGNSAATLNLLKLAKYGYDAKLAQKAEEQIRAFAGAVSSYPSGHALFLIALDFAYGEPMEIIIAGAPDAADTEAMIRAVHRQFVPNALLVLHPPGEAGAETSAVIPMVQDKRMLGGRATAYVCRDFSCQEPTNDVEDLSSLAPNFTS
ncbi:hypothetical protein SD70_19585 [Gordoniibacillus kamchatkensis]|uniref:Spermatogenesis-associated protein 20-like TRX domain-containing protein n=1 Tax=Gordoniibacillus kamchatkensis TaxID=1590651 RepID=A0ABR5AFZ9_9BACL|nr:thioredoxin domain-containing protein [Paenibacillus sp. VKM B-2647]KIL39490.1 hypothetical protein SD70_19585 [Paenibacillus sp. VKM B-2647]